MHFKIYFIILLVTILAGCSKEAADGAFDLGPGEVLMSYQETQCADPWNVYQEIDIASTGTDRVNRLLEFLELHGIEVISVAYEFNDDVIACLECECLSGGVFYIKISNKGDAISQLLDFGFVMI